ncbi:MAG: pentapeptide repeat-containing protein [Thermomicrobiales bacterium]
MDDAHFDSLARQVFTGLRGSRRAAIAALVGGALFRSDLGKGFARTKAKADASVCYPGTRCAPGEGKNASGCDFSGSTGFYQGKFRGANLSNSNFTGAQLAGGDFRGANLSGACLVGANLQAAKLGSSVNLKGAIFCRTLMPDGAFNDRDCDRGTACCPTPPPICEECGDACLKPGETCGLFIGDCCPRYLCTPSFLPVVLSCQIPCGTDADCRYWGPNGKCQYDINSCPFMDRCCVFPSEG